MVIINQVLVDIYQEMVPFAEVSHCNYLDGAESTKSGMDIPATLALRLLSNPADETPDCAMHLISANDGLR